MHQLDDTAADEKSDNAMSEIKASASATPTTSGKRRQSEETYNNTTNEDSLPKKKRESAIRSGNNLKMLIQNKLLHYTPKQKVSPKQVLSLRKEARTETLKTLISAGKFDKLEKLYTKTVVAKSHGSTVNDDTIPTDDSDSNNEPDTIDLPDRNILEPVPISKPNPTNITKKPGRSKTLLRDTVIATNDSDSNNELDTIPPPARNILELVHDNEPNPTNITKNSGKSKTPLPETVDSDSTQISYANNLDQQKESNTYFKEFQSSFNASAFNEDVSTLQNLIQNLAPENGTKHQIKHIEDIYNSLLEVKSKMNAVYTEKSKQLKKAFESINLFVPELTKGLSLPTTQQLKENSRPNSDKLKTVSSLQKRLSQRKGPSSHP